MQDNDKNWKEVLTEEEYRVMRERDTEAPFSGKYADTKEKGTYVCKGCGTELFSSDTKFDSGTGWPSFANPINQENVELEADFRHGMVRTEVSCKKCGAHLGHMFEDGPGGKPRFCINSICLDLQKD